MAFRKPLSFTLNYFLFTTFLHPQVAEGKSNEIGDTTLELVQVVFRYGNRTPEFPYTNDPNAFVTYAPYGWNAMDKAGHQRAYDLGRYLKERYGDFIPQNLNHVRISTTDIDATKISAQLVAAALFPPNNDSVWAGPGSIGDIWQPIPYQFIPLTKDNLIYMKNVPCPAYSQELRLIQDGPVTKSIIEDHRELVEAVYRYARPPTNKAIPEIARLYQSMAIEDFNNLAIPDWAKQFYPDQFLNVSKMYFKTNSWTRRMQRLRGGPLLGQIIRQMELKEKGSELKLWLYSAHDDTLSNIGMAIRIWDDFFPDFCSAMIVELHSNSAREYFVKTFFHNDTSKQPMQLTVPGCEDLCPLNNFQRILNDSIPRNYTAECLQLSSSTATRPAASLLVLLLVQAIRIVFRN